MFYIYIIFDFAMAVIMLLFGIWFYRSKGQASNFLSGYNMKSAEERKKYDENAMCKACLLYTSMEMNPAREWYLVGTPYCGDLEYVQARIPE